LDLSGKRLLPWNNYFYSSFGGLLQSSAQGITQQTTLGGGLGRYFKNTNQIKISVLGGVAWQSTNYHPSIVSVGKQNLAAAAIAAEVNLFKFSKTNLDVTATVFPGLSEPGRVRFNTDMTYYVKIISNLKWNVSFYGNWDNRPPTGFSGSDYGSSSGLSWTFGLK
jgi:putative salt-induced outer membrane protein YdiY